MPHTYVESFYWHAFWTNWRDSSIFKLLYSHHCPEACIHITAQSEAIKQLFLLLLMMAFLTKTPVVPVLILHASCYLCGVVYVDTYESESRHNSIYAPLFKHSSFQHSKRPEVTRRANASSEGKCARLVLCITD